MQILRKIFSNKTKYSLILGVLSGLYSAACFADCTFIVNNNSNYPIKVNIKLGDKTVNNTKVPNSGSKEVLIRSEFACISTTTAGLGIASIDLTGGKSTGGWVFSQDSNMIRAYGVSNFANTGAIGYDPLGHKLLLMHNFKPNRDKFNVIVSRANRSSSKWLGFSE